MMQRQIPSDLERRRFDLAVIGGGINGTAIARDAVLRGLEVILLETADFASGTTSWSTRLIHGGLRYLEHREFGLVHESLRERELLLKHAAHLVKPMPLVLPSYAGASRRPITLRAGLTLYDLLSFRKSLPRHRYFSRARASERWPSLARDGLRGAFLFYDAQVTFPERLVIENLRSAVDAGAVVVNYAAVDRFRSSGTSVMGVEFTDLVDGDRHVVQSRAVVNAGGPWVDQVLDLGGAGRDRKLLGGTKGSHIFLPPFDEAPAEGVYVEAKSDRRPIFVLPWNGLIMVGTTDIEFVGDLDEAHATDEEISYLLDETNALFPGNAFGLDDVLFSYAGVRPLPATSADRTASITRRHFLIDHAPEQRGLYSVVGGKLTTHRSLAESALDTILKELGKSAPCPTRDLMLPGSGEIDPQTLAGSMAGVALEPAIARRLVSIYGSKSGEVLASAQESPEFLKALTPSSPVLGAEVVYGFEQEMATNLADLLLRRIMAAYDRGMGLDVAKAAVAVAKRHLGWTDARVETELARYREALTRFRPLVLR